MDISKLEIEINPEYTMRKKINSNLYLSQEQIDILNEYQIDYMNCPDMNYLIMEVETAYEETNDDILNNLLDVLEEQNYYQNYNK